MVDRRQRYQGMILLLGDDVLAVLAAKLDVRTLGRLACAAQRFCRKTICDPEYSGGADVPAELWSVVEEGARRQMCLHTLEAQSWVSRCLGGSWLRMLGDIERLSATLQFSPYANSLTLEHDGT
eukprot:COSAG02_NODE_415_length_22762_cov_133.681816_3_plen_124_part_00